MGQRGRKQSSTCGFTFWSTVATPTCLSHKQLLRAISNFTRDTDSLGVWVIYDNGNKHRPRATTTILRHAVTADQHCNRSAAGTRTGTMLCYKRQGDDPNSPRCRKYPWCWRTRTSSRRRVEAGVGDWQMGQRSKSQADPEQSVAMSQYISVYITYFMRFGAEAAFCISSLSSADFIPKADNGVIGDKNPALFTCFLELASATLDNLFYRNCTLTVADTIACGSRRTTLCQVSAASI